MPSLQGKPVLRCSCSLTVPFMKLLKYSSVCTQPSRSGEAISGTHTYCGEAPSRLPSIKSILKVIKCVSLYNSMREIICILQSSPHCLPCEVHTHLVFCNHLIFDEKVQNPGELSHREPVVGREVAHVLAVVNYGKSAGFLPYLPGECV